MIKTVIKLDGREEKFDPKKLNNWIQKTVDSIDHNEWSEIALEAIKDLPDVVSVGQLTNSLIQTLLRRDTWTHYLIAGRLLAKMIRVDIYGSKNIPTIKEVQDSLVKDGLMRQLDYEDWEYDLLEQYIDHDKDLTYPHFALTQIRNKYALKNHSTGKEYESCQFVYMRMAMAIFEYHAIKDSDKSIQFHLDTTKRTRLENVINLYRHFSEKRLSAPTPNYNNLGTFHKGYASCCIVAANDSRWSLAAGDHVTYMMTTQSAGIGYNIQTRSITQPVQKGRFLHRGKKPYIDAFGKNIKANLQGGRGGAGTMYISMFDPEAKLILGLRDTRAVDTARNRDAHYAYLTNRFFATKAAKGEKVFDFDIYTAPDLMKAFYGKDIKKFAEIYEKYEKDDTFKKNWFDARELYLFALNQGVSTGTIYASSIDEMNRNTPFLDPIRSSNLCLEVSEPTEGYDGPEAMMDLYSSEEVGYAHFKATNAEGTVFTFNEKASKVFSLMGVNKWVAQDVEVGNQFWLKEYGGLTVTEVISVKREPEVALCSLGAINITEELSDEEYQDVCYYAYKMIDYCILENEYILPHMGVTAKARMNAGLGLMGLSTHLARKKYALNSPVGYQEMHRVFERHLYYSIKASLMISKERGNAKWIDRTYWPEGWTPLKTYRPDVDKIADFKLIYDWELLSDEIKQNGGLAHSCLINYMPGESSSKALGATNSIYGIRKKVMIKVDAGNVIRWAAPYSDDSNYHYQSMWDLSLEEQNNIYAIAQKFTDQAISADWFIDFTHRTQIGSKELLGAEIDRVKKGIKTRYYINTLMPASDDSMKISNSVISSTLSTSTVEDEEVCESCTL